MAMATSCLLQASISNSTRWSLFAVLSRQRQSKVRALSMAATQVDDIEDLRRAAKGPEVEEGPLGGRKTKKEPPPPSPVPKKGQEVQLVCESLAFKGKGVCKVAAVATVATVAKENPDNGFVVMCDKALPGEHFVGRITKKKGSFAEAVKLKTLSPHSNLVVAPCEYASDCGGCKTQNLAYEAQIEAKEQQVFYLISRVGKFGPSRDYMRPIVGCKAQFHYRNKMEFSFGTKEWVPNSQHKTKTDIDPEQVVASDFSLGLHAPGRFDKVLSVRKCLLQENAANAVLEKVHEYCRAHPADLSAYDSSSHEGFLRHLMIRSGRDHSSGEVQLMVNFVTSSYKPEVLQPLVDKLVNEVPQVVCVLNNITTSLSNVSVGEKEYLLFGKSAITETLCGLVFEISANSFFQTNPRQAEVLYKLVGDAAMLRGDGTEVVLDLFCGTGTIGLTLAERAKHVYGYEVVPEAVEDARRNAVRNHISNATFIQGDLNKITDGFGKNFPKIDVVITDPNRPGMHPKLIKFLLQMKAQRIIYVSCNPATCARDLDFLCHGIPTTGGEIEGAYHLVSVQPVDMFPNTPHIECVCVLELN